MATDIKKDLERKTSAVTLSDMEVFIFPELIYSLVLANIMSDRIWEWRNDPWFEGIENMKPYKRIVRLKQYIIDHYMFNLDLDTWGLTTKESEVERFKDIISEDVLASSNALFGYEGDKYYFDIDIRTHFGLDKYEGHIIPYWKTESVEAMDAFKYRPKYPVGAGECVSLATLYAAALFIVARIPLKDIYLMATPLHSQNFVDIDEGILTNNRRLVTKNMWFNGTELSGQARRALENERVTIVAHESGCMHAVYDEATIDKESYNHFSSRLKAYLKVSFTGNIMGNFLRNVSSLQKCFQVRYDMHGVDHYIGAERIFAYEHSSTYRYTDNTREKLFAEIDSEEFRHDPLAGRTVLNDLEDFISQNRIDLGKPEDIELLKEQFELDCCMAREEVVQALISFCHVKPALPDAGKKNYVPDTESLSIDLDMTREEVIDRLETVRPSNVMADMAFYSYRDLRKTDAEPFIKAATERNPVSVKATGEMEKEEIIAAVKSMEDESIYNGPGRLAQPDEVWNYSRGDGLEKAILLANIFHSRNGEANIEIQAQGSKATLKCGEEEFVFSSRKDIQEQVWTVLG